MVTLSIKRDGVIFFLILICALFSSFSPALAVNFPTVLPGENQQIPITGSTVRIKGLVDQESRVFINSKETPVHKDGVFQEEIIIPSGEAEVFIGVVDKKGNIREYAKKIKAKEQYFFLVGVADGTLNIVDTKADYALQTDNSEFKKGIHVDGKISYYLVGKIKGKYLIKSSLDTEKSTQEQLFSNIDPTKYYPVYGDNSTVVYDVNSQGKFYLLVEWEKSGFTFGNYQTQFEETKLACYNRTLYGGKVSLESKERTIYGDPKAKLSGFFAQANQFSGHSEFQGTGGSLYYFRHRNISEGSEKIRLDIRDKNTGMTIYSIPQKENIDYQIKYDEGRIIFYEPVLSVASSDTVISVSILEGNPVFIVADYEYRSQEAFPVNPINLGKKSGGVRVSKTLGDHFRIGGTYLQERKDEKNFQLYGEDITIKLGNFTRVEAEIAQSQAQTIPGYVSYTGGLDFVEVSQENNIKDNASRFSLNSSLGEFLGLGRDSFEVSGYYQKIGNNFSSTDTLYEAGTEKYGVELTHKFSENDRVRFIAQRERLLDEALNQAAENQLTANRKETYSAQWVHTLNKWKFTQEYQETKTHDSLSFYERPTGEGILGERVDFKLNKDTAFFASQQATVFGHSRNQTGIGLTTKINDTQVQAQSAFGNAGNSFLVGLERNLSESISTYMNYTLLDSRIDGKSSTTSFGSNFTVGPDARLRNEQQFVISDVRGVYNSQLMGLDYQVNPQLNLSLVYEREQQETDPNLISSSPRDSVSVNTSYAKPDKLKVENKFEFRKDTDDTQQVTTFNTAELKLNPDLTLFGEYDYSLSRRPGNASYARIDIRQAGFAFRPQNFDWFNCLFKYTREADDRPDDLTSADGGFIVMRSTSDVYAAEFAFDLPYNFQFIEKYAHKNAGTLSLDQAGIIETPDDLKAQLMIHRINYHLTKSWDIAAEYRILMQKGSSIDSSESGTLFEVSRMILDNFYAGVGCNFTSFTDDLTEKQHKSAKGLFFRLQGRY